MRLSCSDRLVGLVVKASASRVADPRFVSRLRHWDFSRSSHTSNLEIVLQWLPCQESGIIVSVLGLVGLMSIYCDEGEQFYMQLLSQLWLQVQLSEQIRP